MKKIGLLVIPFFLSANGTLQEKVAQLEKEINSLKQDINYHQEDLDERIPIIEMVEKKSILDKINLSPELLLRFDKFKYTNRSIEGETTMIYGNPDYQPDGTYNRRTDYTKEFAIASSLRFRLNMEMDLGELKFHGRMLYMNASQANERICILSRDIKTGTAGSAFDIDRAYVDYTMNTTSSYPFTLSFGILPTSGGTPMQYSQGKKRSSMFPALVFDMNTYGLIGTQKLGESTYARLILAKAYTLRANFYPYQCNRENIDNAGVVGLYSDTAFHFLGNSLFSFGFNILRSLKAHPYLGPDVDSSDSHQLGNMLTLGMGLDIEKFANTQTTFFIHTALSNPHANTQEDDYKIVARADVNQTLADGLTYDGKVGFTEADYASGGMLSSNGYALYVGIKHEVFTNIQMGLEYNYGSKYWFSATQGAEDMFNKLATRGSAYELYSTWNFHRNLNTKLAFMNIQEEYTGSGWHFGEPAKKDATQTIVSLSIEAKF